jgi:DNA polymerase phi
MFSGKTEKNSASKNTTITDIDSDDVFPIDEIVDVLIGFLESSTAFSKAIATFAFSHLTSEIRRSTVNFILKVRIDSGHLWCI